MLIRLSDTFLGKVALLARDARFHQSIGNLLLGFREGKHVVMMSRELRKEMERALPSHQGALKHIKRCEQESQALYRVVICSIEVTPEQDGAIERQEIDGATRLLIPYGWFYDSERIQTTILLAESLRDGAIYQQVTLGYLHVERLNLKPQWMLVPGTGGGCSDQFSQWAGTRLLVCVVDSDQRWPHGPLGATAAKVLAAHCRSEPAEVYVLPCHELENLLPEGLLHEVFTVGLKPGQRQNDLSRKFKDFQNLGVLGALGDFAFLDLKAGLSLGRIHTCTIPEEQAYLSRVAAQLQHKCVPPPRGFCPAAPRCTEPSVCDCVLFERWNVLAEVAQYMQRLSNRNEIKRIFFTEPPACCQDAWRDIAQRLLSWGCAFSRIAT